eukprot:SM000055S18237  [mRNA]  locus=s55:255820:257199:+ [translate_table: standard]
MVAATAAAGQHRMLELGRDRLPALRELLAERRRRLGRPPGDKVLLLLEVALDWPRGGAVNAGSFLVDRWPEPEAVVYVEGASRASSCATPEAAERAFASPQLMDGSWMMAGVDPADVAALAKLGAVKQDWPYHLLVLPPGRAIAPLPLPAGYTLGVLEESAAEQAKPRIVVQPNPLLVPYRREALQKHFRAMDVTSHWQYSNDSSYVRRLLQHKLPAYGVRTAPKAGSGRSDVAAAGELVAWALTHSNKSIGIVHVEEAHRRRGLAKVVSIAVIADHLALGWAPQGNVGPSNDASLHLFHSLDRLALPF